MSIFENRRFRYPSPSEALERRRRLFAEVFADFDARGVGLRMADNLPRAALHERSAARTDADPTGGSDSGALPC